MKKNLLSCFAFLLFFNAHSQTVNWTGATSSAYFTSTNWNPATNPAALVQTENMFIGNGSPGNCVHSGGSALNPYRPNKINVLSGATFTVNGTMYAWNSDSLNGTIVINSPADFSSRNIFYVGRNGSAVMNINGGKISSKNAFYIAIGTSGSNATVNMPGGSLTAGTNLDLANGAGLTGRINITGGAVVVPGNLNIGTGGGIFISGIGFLKMTGDKSTQLNSLVADGRLSCTPGKTLVVTYDGTYTFAQIPQDPNGMITEYPDSVVLKTTNLICVIEKNTGNVLSYRYKGVETVANKPADGRKYMYHDFTTSYGFETVWGCTYEIIQDSADFAHIVFKRPYTPAIGHVTPVDCELHYALKKDDKGVYVYSKLEHKPAYPVFDIGSWRQVWWIAVNSGVNLTERIYTDSLRSWQMNAPSDPYVTTGIAEIIKQTGGVRNGKFDGKYEYSLKFWDNPVWGHASSVNNIGIWCLNTSCEYFNEGPMHKDLNAAAGIIHQCMNGVHYGDGGIIAAAGTSWTKVFGPYMLLITDKPTGDENWAAAKQRLVQEKALWPYTWVKDTVAYPPASLRGAINGTFVVSDELKPALTGANAWVGVTDLSDGAPGFQMESKNYQHWVKADGEGNFTIPNVRPGTYSLFAFVDGAVNEYRLDNVTVTAGVVNNLGSLTRVIDRAYGRLVWEIGKPDRTAAEFRLGDFDYCEGFVEQKFRDTFPNPIEYNVADNNWASKLSYAHTKYPTPLFAPGDIWKWRLNFILPAGFSTTGNARLTIAYASNDHAQQWIYVNNEAATPTNFYPDNGDGNSYIRQGNYGKYAYKQVLIPMNKLVVGSNTITLVMPSNSGWVSHLMYDYLSLEANVPAIVILPVTLLSFEARATLEKNVQLTWKTATEINNSHFKIEHSLDGRSYTSVGDVQAAVNSATGSSYTFIHKALADGINYYRLKQVDTDGKHVYSPIRQVNFNAKKIIAVYPNPASNRLFISSANNLKEVLLYNSTGNLIELKTNIAAKQCFFNIGYLAKGVYFIKITDGVSTVVEKVIKDQ